MNKNELQTLLENELLGGEFDIYKNTSKIMRKIRELFPQFASVIWNDYNAKENTCYVSYRGRWLIGWRETKQRGEYLGSWRGYEWTVKSVSLFDWFINDLQERFNAIDNAIEQSEKAKQEKNLKNIENFKKIRALFPNKTTNNPKPCPVWWGFFFCLLGVFCVPIPTPA